MPINDINGIPIAHHLSFPNDDVSNIEFGAGKNYFGKKEFPNCYLTDLSNPDLPHFTHYPNYEIEDCHYLDANCDFFKYSFNRKFENIILCNPFLYGFLGLGDAKKFFDRAGDLLNIEGKIHIVGSSFNKWCSKDSYDDYMSNEIDEYKSNYTFVLDDHIQLTRQHQINTTFSFYQAGLKDRTYPNQILVIKKV